MIIKSSSAVRGGIILRVLLCCVLAFGLLVCVITALNWWHDPARKLRSFATDIHDFTPSYVNLPGDFTRFIRADCSEQDFHRFAREEELTRRLTEEHPMGIMGWPSCDKPWWTPPKSYLGAYYSFENGGECRIMQYEGGHLYYAIIVW